MKKKIIVGVLLFIVLVFSVFIFCFINKNNEINQDDEEIIEPVITTKVEKLSLIMAGDVLLHSAVYEAARIDSNNFDFTSMFTDIKEIVGNYDLAYINQETIIGGKNIGLSTYPRFNSPDEIGDALVDAGFNIINLANNHTLDRGEQAILYSTNYWKTKDVYAVGSYSSSEERDTPVIKNKNGITYSVLSYTTVTNGLSTKLGSEYLLNVYDEEKVKEDIEKVQDSADIVIVSMHWGSEYTHTPTTEEVEIANYLSSLGVDIVIGTHPHVIQPITYIGNTLVIYSLGNFISAQEGEAKLIGMLASLEIVKTTTGDEINIEINNVSGELIYTYHDSKYKNFKIIPFSKLDDSILKGYSDIKIKYNSIITEYDEKLITS
ncbi:MAG: CapA family protein [Bacilli bacterium]